jgi:hypothetical protein
MQIINQKVVYILKKEIIIQNAENQIKTNVKEVSLQEGCDKIYMMGEKVLMANGKELFIFSKNKAKQ